MPPILFYLAFMGIFMAVPSALLGLDPIKQKPAEEGTARRPTKKLCAEVRKKLPEWKEGPETGRMTSCGVDRSWI